MNAPVSLGRAERLADAFTNLEAPIDDLAVATLLLAHIVEDAIPGAEPDPGELRSYALSRDEVRVLFHVVHHVGTLAHDLRKRWHAETEAQP